MTTALVILFILGIVAILWSIVALLFGRKWDQSSARKRDNKRNAQIRAEQAANPPAPTKLSDSYQ